MSRSQCPTCGQIAYAVSTITVACNDEWHRPTKTLLFDPERLPPRDADGYTDHPQLWDERWFDGKPEDEAPLNIAAFTAAGLECAWVAREDQDPEGVQANEDADSFGCARWTPRAPDGEGWRLVSVYNTEDGDAAFFVRDIAPV